MADEKLSQLRQLCGGAGGEVDKQLRKGGEDGLDDATLKRWLVARKGDVKEAAKDLQAHAAWRAAYVPGGIIRAEEVADDIAHNKAFVPGFDRAGRPFTIVVVSRHQVKDAEASKRYIAYALDCLIRLGSTRPGWDGKTSGIFDLRGLKASNCDFATLRNVFDLLQHHYPERLHTLWLYNAPYIFYGLYKMVYPFIDPVTREKVKFIYEKDAEAEFLAAFDPSVLPPEICSKGTGRWVTVQEQYDRLLKDGAAAAGGAQQQQQQPEASAMAAANGAASAAATQLQELQAEAPGEVGLRPIEVVA
ncbi:hypothetical protein PLESTB_000812300 [Pleodorina starrii]|uniref:CRAL-TRIO domain-containing protein n=1 Tax=Pleodorina starrii TaxID=330485 RepID=A0A9W6BLZ7_9CHLO|nr:hypothetical protein PLESTM_000127900 [Pleodorina starrii]GLC53992.1 hypothetical protein PLESTB_000812300 [Pleodorina starrii]GLC64700.1 hypothetical protein PLESTF_000193800 [Pleodorina starrii]